MSKIITQISRGALYFNYNIILYKYKILLKNDICNMKYNYVCIKNASVKEETDSPAPASFQLLDDNLPKLKYPIEFNN